MNAFACCFALFMLLFFGLCSAGFKSTVYDSSDCTNLIAEYARTDNDIECVNQTCVKYGSQWITSECDPTEVELTEGFVKFESYFTGNCTGSFTEGIAFDASYEEICINTITPYSIRITNLCASSDLLDVTVHSGLDCNSFLATANRTDGCNVVTDSISTFITCTLPADPPVDTPVEPPVDSPTNSPMTTPVNSQTAPTKTSIGCSLPIAFGSSVLYLVYWSLF